MITIGDILVDETLSCEVLVVAKENGYYRTRHISGIFDGCPYRLYEENKAKWYIFTNIFRKEN